MTNSPQHGPEPTATFEAGELAELRALADRIERDEQLDLRIVWDALASRTGESASDFIYRANGRIVGFLMLDGLGDGTAEATGMVDPVYRRRGIFRELVGAARAACQQQNTAAILFTADRRSESARSFLDAIGARYEFAEQRMRLDAPAQPLAAGGDLAVAPATAADTAEIAAISAADDGGDPGEFAEHIAANMRRPNYQYYLARHGDAAVGTINIQILNGDAYVYGFVVRPEQRGRGYGRQILAQVVDTTIAAQPRPIFLEVETENVPALTLYRSLGFQTTHTFDYYRLKLATA